MKFYRKDDEGKMEEISHFIQLCYGEIWENNGRIQNKYFDLSSTKKECAEFAEFWISQIEKGGGMNESIFSLGHFGDKKLIFKKRERTAGKQMDRSKPKGGIAWELNERGGSRWANQQ